MALSVSSTTNCKIWMSMMVPDKVDMEHEVVNCGIYMVNMDVVKRENESKEVGELRLLFLSCRYTNPIHCLTHSFATSL